MPRRSLLSAEQRARLFAIPETPEAMARRYVLAPRDLALIRGKRRVGLNKGEASNALRRAVFFHRQGEIRDRTFENQSFRASGLSLITAAIVHWNTVYLARAVQHLRAQNVSVPDDLLTHVAPLGWEHIALTGNYVWANLPPTAGFRPLRDVQAPFQTRPLSIRL